MTKNEDWATRIYFECHDKHQPTENELIQAGIKLDVWHDPESWGDKEQAFFWERECRRMQETNDAPRAELAEFLQCPATWEYIVKTVKKRLT